LWELNLAGCHGDDGNGGSERGILGEDDAETADIVLNGEESMPTFADILSDQDVTDVIAWLGAKG
jgi:mono/diheme cytochrome c family protein